MATIEKAIAAALEPLLDDLIALEKRFDELEPAPAPAPPLDVPGLISDVAAHLKHDAEFLAEVRADIETTETVDIDPAELVQTLRKDAGLMQLLRGPQGDGIGAPTYVNGAVYREGATVTAHLGQFFRALRDTVSAPGDSDDWERIGGAGFRWRKIKPDEKSLREGDLYIDGGSLFLYSDGRPSMFVQRGKSGHAVTAIKVDGGDLVCEMDSGKQYRASLKPLVDAVAQSIGAQLKIAGAALDDLAVRLAVIEGRVEMLDAVVGGDA